MQVSPINNTYSPKFSARNPTIRFADDIARRVNQCYPRISLTLIEDLPNAHKFPALSEKLSNKINAMRNKMNFMFKFNAPISEQLKAITGPIKTFKLGNCGESADLTEIAARVNGIKDCGHASLFIEVKGHDIDLDHAVLLVEDHKAHKPYIIDSWLGFADYIPNAIQRYKNEFRHHFDIKGKNPKFYIDFDDESISSEIFKHEYSEQKLKELYPELILRK